MARFNAAVMSGASDNKFQNIYNYLLDLLDQAYVVEKMINGKMSRVEISPEHGIVISYDGNNILSTDPLTGRLSLGSEGNLYIDTEDGIVIRSTIDGKESILQLNDTVGIAFFNDETYRGGLGVREDKLSLITDILGTVDDKYHFVEFDKHKLYDSASETYSMLKFFASNNEAIPAAIETFRMASRYWPTTDLAQTFLGTTINGTTVDASELFLSSGMSLETPVGSAYLRLNASVASHTASIDLLAINTYENSCGFMIRANQTTPHIDVIVDYNIIGEWLSGGLKINNNYVWHEGNDGAGSGLNADLLDGKHASELTEITFEKGAGADSGNSTTVWCRIATFQATSRWSKVSTTILLNGGASTVGNPYAAMLHLSVVQQNILGDVPFGRLCIGNNIGLSTTSVKAIITVNTTSMTEIQLWIQAVHTYKTFRGKVLDEYNPGFSSSYSLSSWVADGSLPAGTELSVVQLT